mgnify:FL=1
MISHEVEEEQEQEEEEDTDGEEGQEYLFFDIESRQDDGRHIANLLIVQDETGFEMVFKGDDCVNLRGYNGFLPCEYFYKERILPSLILNGAKIMSM